MWKDPLKGIAVALPTDVIEVDSEIINALREVLGDTDSTALAYSEGLCVQALRSHRQHVRCRDPLTLSVGLLMQYPWNPRIPIARSDIADSILEAAPGGREFQALPWLRCWDPKATPEVWKDGVKQSTSVYVVDYINGRIVFEEALEDYRVVQASFTYYHLLRAARFCVATRSANNAKTLTSVKIGADSFTFASPGQALRALDQAIASLEPQYLTLHDRKY